MNITDLRDELSSRVEDVDADPTMAAAVAGRIRATKRRRTAAVVGAACAVLALAGVTAVGAARTAPPAVPAGTATQSVMIGSDGMPYRAVPPAAGDVVRDGLRYRAKVAGDRLAVASIGALGQQKVTMTWTPTTTHVSVAAQCSLPVTDDQAAPGSGPTAWLVIDGKRVLGVGCDAKAPGDGLLSTGTGTLGETGAGWDRLVVGRPVTVTVEVLDRDDRPVTDPGLRVSGAIYLSAPGREVIEAGTGRTVTMLPELLDRSGHLYRLDSHVTEEPARSTRLLTVDTPADVPFLVTFGSAGTDPENSVTADGYGTDTLSGLDPGGSPSAAMGVLVTAPQPARGASTVSLNRQGPLPPRGVALIAIYTLVD